MDNTKDNKNQSSISIENPDLLLTQHIPKYKNETSPEIESIPKLVPIKVPQEYAQYFADPSQQDPSSRRFGPGGISIFKESAQISLSPQNCSICECLKPHSEIFSVAPTCYDTFCYSCLFEYLKLKIEESEVLKIPCPNPSCESEVSQDFIHKIVTAELFQKYLRFKNIEELSKNPMLKWCPQPDCTGYDVGGFSKQMMTCYMCKFQYCYYCSEPWHGKNKCKASIDKELDEWSKRNGVKYCPNCKRKVEKRQGCDHMTCTKCKYEWCWLCGEEYSGNHYATCEMRKYLKWNPPILTIVIIFFAPLLLFCLPVVGLVLSIEKIIDDPRTLVGYKKFLRIRWLSYPCFFVLGVILIPVYIAFGPIIGSIVIGISILRPLSRVLRAIIGLILGIACIPIFIAIVLVASLISHLASWVYLSIKIYVLLRRCVEPSFLKPKGIYGMV